MTRSLWILGILAFNLTGCGSNVPQSSETTPGLIATANEDQAPQIVESKVHISAKLETSGEASVTVYGIFGSLVSSSTNLNDETLHITLIQNDRITDTTLSIAKGEAGFGFNIQSDQSLQNVISWIEPDTTKPIQFQIFYKDLLLLQGAVLIH